MSQRQMIKSTSSRSIREWYRLSRPGTRGEFLREVRSLSSEALVALLKQETSALPRGTLRSKTDLEELIRTDRPTVECLQAAKPTEQTLQWLFAHRGYLTSASEPILWRELPTCCVGEYAEGRADLLAFDHAVSQPILVELKDDDACDPLSGAVLELLYHWTFHMQHLQHFHALLSEFACVPQLPPRLALIAPNRFFVDAKARSRKRGGEYEQAIEWIEKLFLQRVVALKLQAVEDGWQNAGVSFRITEVLKQ